MSGVRRPFLDELTWRGQLHQTSADAALADHLATPPRVGYCGFDPSADSLTIGNYIPIKLLMHWQRCGHRPIVLMGGGTGLIGDPSGKDQERQLLSREEVEANVASQRRIFEQLLDFDAKRPDGAVIVNNLDWLGELGYIQVLRDVGKHFSINAMLQRDSVRARLEGREQGISYTEFSYMILQAYDFLHLHRTMDCTVQLAGSDQYGNILSGIDLIRRETGSGGEHPAYGITAPLVTHADGRKIGKTERGAIWLTADRTSPYAFYQYWINVDDAEVDQFLRWFTLLEREAIEETATTHAAAPHERCGQRRLAEEMTRLIHGAAELRRAELAATALFGGGNVRDLDATLLEQVVRELPVSTHAVADLSGDGVALVGLLPLTSLATSKRQAREFLGNQAVSVNGERVEPDRTLSRSDLLPGGTILVRRGKREWHATRWE